MALLYILKKSRNISWEIMITLVLPEQSKPFNSFISNRFLFVIEIVIALFINYLLYQLSLSFLTRLSIDSNLLMILEMGVSAFIVLFSFGITYLIVNAFFHKDQPQEPAKIFSAFKITRENWKQQIIVTHS